MARLALVVALALLAACGSSGGEVTGPTMNNKIGGGDIEYRSPVVSWDILDREPVANEAKVRHILIGWKDLADAYGGRIPPSAAARSRKDAETEVQTIMGQIQGGGDFIQLMKEKSEDGGSANSDYPITVTPEPPLAIEFRQLSLRLKPGEIGVCQTEFGFHIIRRD
jgi:hypothetical protein